MEAIQTELAALRKDVTSLAKIIRKIRNHQEDPSGEKMKERTRNNGFNRPMGLSAELQEFLGTDETQLSRSAVTRRVNEYVKANNLKHPDNGRVLILDDKLTSLLKPPDGMQITYLNIQKYLTPHYSKVDDEPQDAVVAESVAENSGSEEVTSTTPKKKPARPVVKKVVKA